YPFLVHGVVDARQDAHDLTATTVDPDVGPDGVHHVDGFGLVEFPRTGLECVGLAGERTDRTEVDDIATELTGQCLLEIGGDLQVLAPADRPELGHAGHFRGEADATRAL